MCELEVDCHHRYHHPNQSATTQGLTTTIYNHCEHYDARWKEIKWNLKYTGQIASHARGQSGELYRICNRVQLQTQKLTGSLRARSQQVSSWPSGIEVHCEDEATYCKEFKVVSHEGYDNDNLYSTESSREAQCAKVREASERELDAHSQSSKDHSEGQCCVLLNLGIHMMPNVQGFDIHCAPRRLLSRGCSRGGVQGYLMRNVQISNIQAGRPGLQTHACKYRVYIV